MLTFVDFLGDNQPLVVESLEDLLHPEDFQELEENLGNLNSLGAGQMINVFKQDVSRRKDGPMNAYADSNKLSRWSGAGAGSEVKDLGAIKSWKDIRKEAKGENVMSGFVVYVNSKPYMTVNSQGTEKFGLNDGLVVAIDASVLPEDVQASIERQIKMFNRPKTGTGFGMTVRDLEKYIDSVIAADVGKVSAKAVLSDKAGRQKANERYATKQTNDPLAKREASGRYGSRQGINPALADTLVKHKAGKRVSFEKTDTKGILAHVLANKGEFSIGEALYYSKLYLSKYAVPETAITDRTGFIVTIKGAGYTSLTIRVKFDGDKLVAA